MRTTTLIAVIGMIGVVLAAPAKDPDVSKLPPPADRQNLNYEQDIQPIFRASCLKCHGPEKPKAKLRLDTLQGTLTGGEDGKVVVPGNSAKSMLVINVARIGDKDSWMPPPNNKMKVPPLTREQIGLIRAWIDQGAK